MHLKLSESTKFIESKIGFKPKIAVVLGSGLSHFSERLENQIIIPFSEIPHFPSTTVEGHEGRLIAGTISNPRKNKKLEIIIQQGRVHHYEGYPMSAVVFPTRALCLLGVETLVLTNSSGGVNPEYRESDLMLISDHINLMNENPLRGPNSLGPRFPDLSDAYCFECRQTFKKAAEKLGIELKEGIYAAVSGPTYETPAEVRMLRLLGADAVGMSTVPESIAANHLGVRVVALSCITNLAAGITARKLSHAEVLENAEKSVHKLITLLDEALFEL